MTFKRAALNSVFWLVLAVAIGLSLRLYLNADLSNQFLAGYFAELSLSLDNVFIFVLLFKYFSLSEAQQARVLTYGLIGAAVFRLVFILVGVAVLNHFHWVIYLLGGILIVTAVKLMLKGKNDNGFDPESFFGVKIIKRILGVPHQTKGNAFFVTTDAGLTITQLFLVLIVVESADLLFAIDSIPAVLSVTKNSTIAFISNVLAIVGLRSLYFLVRHAGEKAVGLSYSLIGILLFMGLKMTLSPWLQISAGVSLAVIAGLLGLGFLLQIVQTKLRS